MKMDTLARIKDLGILAVLRAPSAETAVLISDALISGGVKGIEITFTTPDALQAVIELSKKYGDQIVLGMGTLTEASQADAAKDAGANFLVSPHIEPQLAKAMVASSLPCMMGALTPSEVVQAYQLGSDVVKLFPGSLGGPGYMRGLRGPFPDIPMMPTGGVSVENIKDWFAAGAFAVGVGSALFPKNWVAEGNYAEIAAEAEIYKNVVDAAKNNR